MLSTDSTILRQRFLKKATKPSVFSRPKFLTRRYALYKHVISSWFGFFWSKAATSGWSTIRRRGQCRPQGDAACYLCVVFRSGIVQIEINAQRKKPHRQLNWYERNDIHTRDSFDLPTGSVPDGGAKDVRAVGRKTLRGVAGTLPKLPLRPVNSPLSFIFHGRCAPIFFSPLFASPKGSRSKNRWITAVTLPSPLRAHYSPALLSIRRCARRFVCPSICWSPNGLVWDHGTSYCWPWCVPLLVLLCVKGLTVFPDEYLTVSVNKNGCNPSDALFSDG